MEAGQRLGQALVVAGEPAAAGHPGEGTLDDPPAGQQDEPPLRRGRCDHLQDDAVRLGGLGRPLTGIALVDVGQRDVLAGGVLDRLGQLGHRRAVVLAGGRHVQGQQVAKGVHGEVQLGAARALVAVPSRARAALGRAAQGPAVQDGGGRLLPAPRRQAQHRPQVVRQHLEAARPQPPHRLVVHGVPRRQVVGHRPPRDAVAHHAAQAVERLAQQVGTLPGGLGQQGQVGHGQRPFFIGDIGRVRLAGGHHARDLGTTVQPIHNRL